MGRRSFWCMFDVHRIHISPRYARRTISTFSFPMTLTFVLLIDLTITSLLSPVTSILPIKCEQSTVFHLSEWKVYMRQIHKYRKKIMRFSWWNVFDDICRKGRDPNIVLLLVSIVNGYTFDRYVQKRFFSFCPFDIKFVLSVTHVEFLRLSDSSKSY